MQFSNVLSTDMLLHMRSIHRILIIVAYAFTISAQVDTQTSGITYDKEFGILGTEFFDSGSTPLEKKNTSSQQKAKTNSTQKKSRPNFFDSLSSLETNQNVESDERDPSFSKANKCFEQGMELFKESEFSKALKKFECSVENQRRPEYLLWIAKTYNKLNAPEKMIACLEIIIAEFEDSDVADDAMYEIALYYRQMNDFEKAIDRLSKLIQLYPMARSLEFEEDLVEKCRQQRQELRTELLSSLETLGFSTKSLSDGIRQFQRDHNLSVSGTPNQQTVLLLKKLSNQEQKNHILSSDTLLSLAREPAPQTQSNTQKETFQNKETGTHYPIALYGGIFILIITTIVISYVRIQVVNIQSRLSIIKEMVVDWEKRG